MNALFVKSCRNGRRFGLAALVLAGSLAAQDKAFRVIQPERKLGLVIGNEAYRDQSLDNPVNDAKAIAGVLEGRLGFDDVAVYTDLRTVKEMKEAVRSFSSGLGPNDLAFFYCSGHGIQVDRRNYLLPSSFESRTEAWEVPHETLSQA